MNEKVLQGSSIAALLFKLGVPGLIFLALLFFSILIGLVGSLFSETEKGGGIGGTAAVTSEVLRWEPLVSKYAEKYGVGDHVQLLLAKIMQESGGRHLDVMQSSESIGLPPNSITDPELSIDVGIRYFAQVLNAAGGDVKLALQSYNFGSGFIPYAQERGGYSKEVAVEFSNMMAAKMGWSRYGDVNYVDNVLRYLPGANNGTIAVNAQGFSMPIPNGKVTSNFGYRYHPLTGEYKMHAGTDFSCGRQNIPIHSAKAGTVTTSKFSGSAGNYVVVDHGEGVQTRYLHFSKTIVSEGQTVQQGEQLGNCGATGDSDGIHLHFEVIANGTKVDPLPYIQ